jgi:hypothetical protein
MTWKPSRFNIFTDRPGPSLQRSGCHISYVFIIYINTGQIVQVLTPLFFGQSFLDNLKIFGPCAIGLGLTAER